MRNKLLFIESNTTGSGMHALMKAAELGLVPVFFTNKPERYPELEKMNCQVHLCDTNDVLLLEQTVRRNVPKQEIAGFFTTSEFYLETTSILASLYGLPGNPPNAVRKARDKSLTREILARAGVCQPDYKTIRHVSQVKEAVERIGLPCVLKPVDDSGSNLVRLCYDITEAEALAEMVLVQTTNVRGQRTAGIVLVEEYIEAPEYSVEMFSWQGKSTCIGVTEKTVTGEQSFVESCHLFPASISKEQKRCMVETVQFALRALRIQNGATHTEVKWTDRGCSIIEINARLAGGMIPELIRLTTGVDMMEQQIQCAVNGPGLIADPETSGVAGIQFIMPEKTGKLLEIVGMDAVKQMPGIQEVKLTVSPGACVQLPHNAYHRLGYVIAHGSTMKETIHRLQSAVNGLHMTIEEKEGVRP